MVWANTKRGRVTSGEKDIVEIGHPKYKSSIIEDPDGHAIELFVNK